MKKKILVTGSTGFIGRQFISALSKDNKFTIHGLYFKNLSRCKKIKGVKYIRCDIGNHIQLKKKIKDNYTYILNFAGNIDHQDKIQTYRAHFLGVKNLLNVINLKKIKSFIQVGSSLEYGNIKSPQSESEMCRPLSYYGKCKLLATKLIKKKLKNYIVLRLYQIYGPYQKTNRLIPYIINSCIKNKSFPCTTGSQLRDFLYVDDLINLIIKILKSKKIEPGIYNIGEGKPIKVKTIINLIKKIIKKGNPQYGKIKMRKDETNILYPSILKIQNQLKWKPNTKILNGIKKTINFYKKI